MSPLERKVLDEIAKRGLKPTPAYRFLARHSVFWLLAVLSVLLGGISVAVGLFAIADFASTGGRRFTDMPFDEMLLSLPAVWAIATPLFLASAVFSLRHTRRGYRLRLMSISGAVVAASLLIGAILHGLDAGRRVHEFLAARIPGYAEATAVPYAEWSRPDEGYLGGEALAVAGTRLRLKAFDGREWTVDISGARLADIDGSLVEEGDVAITGKRTGPAMFKAETIAPFD